MKFIQLVGAAFGPRAVQLLGPAFGRPAVLNFSTSALALLSLAACGSEAQRSGSNGANVASIGPDPQAACAGSSGTDANPQGPSGGADAAAAASNNDAAAAPDGRPQLDIDPRRSLAITEQPIVSRFSLERVMRQLIATSGVSNLTPVAFFQQWWDTENPKPGVGPGPHCDDTSDENGTPMLNGYPITCRPAPAEGGQATCDPFSDPESTCSYIPVGLFMRFDAAPAKGSNCGEYRIVYAKQTGRALGSDRNLLIFEAALTNPHPELGIEGCRRFVSAWADLSNTSDIGARADVLEAIYFRGYQDFDPVVQWSNFGDNADGAGQVRTNQFVQPETSRAWSLREFKIRKECADANCTLRFVPVTDKTNPFGPLFDYASTNPNAAAFRTEFLTKIEGLAAPALDGIGMHSSEVFNSAQSQASGGTETNYVVNFGTDATAFRGDIQARLTALGSTLLPEDVVMRAQAMSCAGCHRLSSGKPIGGNLTWPASIGFTHISERDVDLEFMDGVTRYRISPALTDAFLPHRKQLVKDYLRGLPLPPRAPNEPIGGNRTH